MKYKIGDRVKIMHPILGQNNFADGQILDTMYNDVYYVHSSVFGEQWWSEFYLSDYGNCNGKHNIIFVTHCDDKRKVKKKYMFGIESDADVRVGDKLFAQTIQGEKLVTAVTEPFFVNANALNQLSLVLGGKSKLQFITGNAVETFEHEPLLKKGMRK